MNVLVIHNILWSSYKAGVFSELNRLSDEGLQFRFLQIAETERERRALSEVDRSLHDYPYTLLFKGALEEIHFIVRTFKLIKSIYYSRCQLVLIPGFYRIEYWAAWLYCLISRRGIGLFCDSTMRDASQSTVKTFLKRLFVRKCDLSFGYGERSVEYLRYLGAPESGIFKRCQAACLPKGYSGQRALSLRKAAIRNSPNLSVLFVGRLSPEKGIHTLIDAVRILVGKFPDVRLDVVGSGPDEATLKDAAFDRGIAENVVFHGSMNQSDIHNFYSAARVLVLPSFSEPWGLVVNEALSFGCPVVVSSNCGCCPELVVEGKTGFVFRAGDANDLAQQIERALSELSIRSDVWNACIALMENFSPTHAAHAISEGCKSYVTKRHPG